MRRLRVEEAMTGPEFEFGPVHLTKTVEEDGMLFEEAVTPPVCDFCLDRRVRWEYPCRRFVVGLFGSDGPWLACDRCAALIEVGEDQLLAERSHTSWVLRGQPVVAGLIDDLRLMQGGFREHRVGARRAFG